MACVKQHHADSDAVAVIFISAHDGKVGVVHTASHDRVATKSVAPAVRIAFATPDHVVMAGMDIPGSRMTVGTKPGKLQWSTYSLQRI